MTLADLLSTLESRTALPPSRMKDCKTSLRYLAAALDQGTLEDCLIENACRDPALWTTALETYFAALAADGKVMSAATQRNTRNNCRVIFRLAEAHGLLPTPLPPRLLTKPHRKNFEREQSATTPYRSTYRHDASRGYALPQAQWPSDIVQGWRGYQAQCGLRLRETTLQNYVRNLTLYVGYIANIQGAMPTWESLFDVGQLTAFLRWHGGRMGRPVSSQGWLLTCQIAAIANVLKHPQARALADFRNTLPPITPLHNKKGEHHWVSLATLEAVANACLDEGHAPFLADRRSRNPGVRQSTRFQRGLMLKLLVRVPLRQRNLREMKLDRNLYQAQGHWHLHFRGDELKIGYKERRVNEYKIDLTKHFPELIPLLEEWLRVHRPRFPKAMDSTHLFLTRHGGPYTDDSLHGELSVTVAMRTGQRFYPHLIRTIWATEYIKATHDYDTAAAMLGDTIGVVIKTYRHIVDEEQHANAATFLQTALKRE